MNGLMKCRAARKNARKLLCKFRKSLYCAERVDYCCARREYTKKKKKKKKKKLLQQKKKEVQ